MTLKPFGPENPHPLSRIKTELIWEGKYDEYGNRRPVHLPSTTYPLQRIESIDEPRDRQKATQNYLPFDEEGFNKEHHPDDFRNMLIWGDNKLVMASLLENYRGMVDLIYIDPPFDVGADFSLNVQLGDSDEKVFKEQSVLEAVAYRDTWGRGMDSYLQMMHDRLLLIKELLSDSGILYLHCDYRVNFSLRFLLNEIFDSNNFRNEIIWYYSTLGRPNDRFAYKHDVIFAYGKSTVTFFNLNKAKVPYSQEYISSHFRDRDEKGRICRKRFDAGKWRTYYPEEGMIPNDVWEIPYENSMSSNRFEFPTQKPESLLERIVNSSSEETHIIADFFCGSGTTMAVAEKLGRRWIGVDLGRYAIHTSRKRLIQVQRELQEQGKPYRAFDVYNLGRYERQWWQLDRLKGADAEHRSVVLRFYKAAPLKSPSNPLLHGTKPGVFIHVSQIDTIFTFENLLNVSRACAAAGGKELHVLAWEFEMELSQRKPQVEAETHVVVRLKYIPREIMEANRTEVQFFEAGALQVKPLKKEGYFDVELVSFSPALAEAPEKELVALRERALKSPFDFIDFWAVDFDWSSDAPFEHHWQDFRTRRDRQLLTKSNLKWEYSKKGKHNIAVKVIDVFGVDTTAVIEVES